MKPVWLLLAFALLFPLLSAYTDHSLSIKVTVRQDGTAHIREKAIVYMDTKDEIEAFKVNLRLGKSTLLDWKKFSENIGYHIGGTQGAVANLNVTAGPEYDLGYNARAIIIDYDLSSSFVNVSKAGSRTKQYALREDALGFERSQLRQVILANNFNLSIELPSGATISSSEGVPQIGPTPYLYDPSTRTIIWLGPMTGKWLLVYEIEEPLSTEVYDFFSNAYKQAIELVPLLLLGLLAVFVFIVLVKIRKP